MQPPDSLSCGDYMNLFVDNFGGYLENPNDFSDCRYCAIRTADQFLEGGFNIFYSNRWRDFGIVVGVSMFNVSRSQFLTDLTWSLNFLDIRFCACTHSPTSLGFGKVPYLEVYSDEDLNWSTKIYVPTI